MEDSKTEMTAVREAALEVIYRNRLAVANMKDVREFILAGDRLGGIEALISRHELSRNDAEAVMAYMEPSIRGKRTSFVEITPSEIYFPSDDELTEFEDPLDPGFLYFGRRGNRFGEVVTTTSERDGKLVDEVYFCNERLTPCKLDQVWKVVQEEPVAAVAPDAPAPNAQRDEKTRRLDELLAARRALNVRFPLEIYEQQKVEPEEVLAYCRLSIQYATEFDISEIEHAAIGWSPIPLEYIKRDGSVRPEYRQVRRYPPLPEGLYAQTEAA